MHRVSGSLPRDVKGSIFGGLADDGLVDVRDDIAATYGFLDEGAQLLIAAIVSWRCFTLNSTYYFFIEPLFLD